MAEKGEVIDNKHGEIGHINGKDVIAGSSRDIAAEIDEMQADIADVGRNHAYLIGIHEKVQSEQVLERKAGVCAGESEDEDGGAVVADADVVVLEAFALDVCEVALPGQTVRLREEDQHVQQGQHRRSEDVGSVVQWLELNAAQLRLVYLCLRGYLDILVHSLLYR